MKIRERRNDNNARPSVPLLIWPTVMRVAFEKAAPHLVGRSRAGLRRVPAWSVIRNTRRYTF